MASRKQDLKDNALEAFYAAKSFVEELLGELKSRDRFFKYKFAIVSAWLVVSFGTLFAACPGGSGTLADNGIGAHVQVARVLDSVSVLVQNDSTDVWKDVNLKLNGQYLAAAGEVPPGGKVVLLVQQFVGPGGKVPPKDLQPQSLRISCSEGNFTADLTKPSE